MDRNDKKERNIERNNKEYIVACHLPRGSKLRWCEDMGGGLPNVRNSNKITNNSIKYMPYELPIPVENFSYSIVRSQKYLYKGLLQETHNRVRFIPPHPRCIIAFKPETMILKCNV